MTAVAVVLVISTRLGLSTIADEEGLPRGLGYAVAALLTLAFVVGAARLADVGWAVELAAVGTLLVGIGIALLNEESPPALAMGHVLFLFGGLGVVWGVVLTLTYAVVGLRPVVFALVVSLWLALFGAVGAGAKAVGEGRITTALEQGWAVVVVLLIAFVPLTLIVGGLLFFGPGITRWLVAPGGARPALVSLAFLVGLAGLAVRIGLGRLPVVQLAGRRRRSRVVRARDVGRRAGGILAVVGIAGAPILALFELSGAVGGLYGALPGPAVSVLAALTNASVLRAPLLGLFVVLAVVVPIAVLLRGVTSDDFPSGRRHALAFGVALLVFLPVPLLARFVLLSPGTSGTAPLVFGVLVIAYLVVAAATAIFLTLLSALPVAAGVGLLPDRGGGIALMAGGVFLATVSMGLGGAPWWAVYAGVAVALVVWDLSEFGLGLAEEVGRLPDVRRVELLHGVGSVAVAVAGLGIAAGLRAATNALGGAAPGALTASVAALVGTALLLAALRG